MRKVLYMLGQLSDEHIEWLIAHGQRQNAPAGTVLIEQGQPSDLVLIVLDGTLDVRVRAGGREQVVATRGTGEILGEMSFIDNRPPTATVVAAGDAVLFTIPKTTLAAHLEEDRDFAACFYRGIAISLSYRMRELMAGPDDQAVESVDDIENGDTLDSTVLESAYLAGLRFERMIQRMLQQ